MLIVAGITLKQLQPRVWDFASPYYLKNLPALMLSYADLHQMPKRRRDIMSQGMRSTLGVTDSVKMYLDNGAFYFLRQGGERDVSEYAEFVATVKPDWYPIPQDYIPSPNMSTEGQRECLARTMQSNLSHLEGGYVPVIHICQLTPEYVSEFQKHDQQLSAKPSIAIGGIVPNLLRMPKARPHQEILQSILHIRTEFADKHLHLFGVGGTATLHVAALLGMDSVDSSGWRNRAARGLIQLPGRGDRYIAELGSWRGRKPSPDEWTMLDACECPACQSFGQDGLLADKSYGFANRATHNLYTLLEEARLIQEHLAAGTYREWFETHLDNTIYRPLILKLLDSGAAEARTEALKSLNREATSASTGLVPL